MIEPSSSRERKKESCDCINLLVGGAYSNNLLMKSRPMNAGLIPRREGRHDEKEKTRNRGQEETDSQSQRQSDTRQKNPSDACATATTLDTPAPMSTRDCWSESCCFNEKLTAEWTATRQPVRKKQSRSDSLER
uniref:Uncharacterized protein n=1 Tax=Daphnia galeata TaxID=27404 RepID=A0A8J2RKU8_9CRUS|nr:unnamed protein product [Daphnia galeata]